MIKRVLHFMNSSVRRPDGTVDPMQVFFAAAFPVFIMVIGLLVYGYWFQDVRPAVVTQARPVVSQVRPGGSFTYAISGCKFTRASATVRRSWVDGIVFTMPEDHPTTLRTGCYSDLLVSFQVPEALPPGLYHVEVEIVYHINQLRDRSIVYIVGPVWVEPPPEEDVGETGAGIGLGLN